MKRMIAKILFPVLLINCVATHIDCAPVPTSVPAGWTSYLQSAASTFLQVVRNEAKSGLRSIAKNPGWTSLVVGGVICNMAVIARYRLQTAKEKQDLIAKETELADLNNPKAKQQDVDQHIVVPSREPQDANEQAAADAFAEADSHPQPMLPADNKIEQITKLTEDIVQRRNALSDKLYWTKLVCAGTVFATAGFAGMGILVSKACRWMGSKI